MKLEKLEAGYIWARHSTAKYSKTKFSKWCIVEVTGKPPFLKAAIVFTPEGGLSDVEPCENFSDPNKWQFGPRLNIPDDWWAEPMQKVENEEVTKEIEYQVQRVLNNANS